MKPQPPTKPGDEKCAICGHRRWVHGFDAKSAKTPCLCSDCPCEQFAAVLRLPDEPKETP